MPRRRLYGETQKRRQKAQTAQLKRSRSVHRVEATQAPAPFERTDRLERPDVEFLEAMRELRVQPNRQRTIPPQRLREVARMQVENQDSASEFLEAMERLGVRPWVAEAGSRLAGPPRPAAPPRALPSRDEPRRAADRAAAAGGPSGDAAGTAAPGRLAEAGAPRVARPGTSGSRAAPPEPVRFEDEGRSMADLPASVLNPGGKYKGAPSTAGRAGRDEFRPHREDSGPEEPDDTLDLHGKTQEEAIRMVQNFLLTAHRSRCRAVLIITGRGLRSGEQGPVLRDAVRQWLARNGERFLKYFRPAPGRHGGEGAIWVKLR